LDLPDHGTLQPVDYYFKVPGDTGERDFFLLDPMLATGGSAAATLQECSIRTLRRGMPWRTLSAR